MGILPIKNLFSTLQDNDLWGCWKINGQQRLFFKKMAGFANYQFIQPVTICGTYLQHGI
jgi:hypothetical protein